MRSVWESYGRKVEPASLYLAQKAEHMAGANFGQPIPPELLDAMPDRDEICVGVDLPIGTACDVRRLTASFEQWFMGGDAARPALVLDYCACSETFRESLASRVSTDTESAYCVEPSAAPGHRRLDTSTTVPPPKKNDVRAREEL